MTVAVLDLRSHSEEIGGSRATGWLADQRGVKDQLESAFGEMIRI